jgi:hypothetical protein
MGGKLQYHNEPVHGVQHTEQLVLKRSAALDHF